VTKIIRKKKRRRRRSLWWTWRNNSAHALLYIFFLETRKNARLGVIKDHDKLKKINTNSLQRLLITDLKWSSKAYAITDFRGIGKHI